MTHTMQRQEKGGESGNALFLILIAVALFAALSYAVTQSGRGSGTIDKEQSLIAASQITQYPSSVRTAVTRMVITGTSVTALDFTHDGTQAGDSAVFATDGGGSIYQDPPANIGTATSWTFLDATHATDGWFITGIGTDDATTGREVIAVLDGLTLAVCQQILKGLGLSSTPLVEATATSMTVPGAGTGAGDNAYSFHAWNADPQTFACIRNGAAGNYVYYHSLVEQ